METQFSINGNGRLSDRPVNGSKEIDKLQLRSDAVQEILSRRPDFMTRWSLIIFFLVLMTLFASTWFIKYPDIIQANASLTAANAPKELVTRHEGKIVRIFTSNDRHVRSGEMIAWLESTADHKEMIDLSGSIRRALYFMSTDKTEKVSGTFRRTFRELGEVQSDYQQFIKSFDQVNEYKGNGVLYKPEQGVLYV
jgi:HlyD family secretion protein